MTGVCVCVCVSAHCQACVWHPSKQLYRWPGTQYWMNNVDFECVCVCFPRKVNICPQSDSSANYAHVYTHSYQAQQTTKTWLHIDGALIFLSNKQAATALLTLLPGCVKHTLLKWTRTQRASNIAYITQFIGVPFL